MFIRSPPPFIQIRGLINMCSAPLDLFSMLELGGQQPSSAMVAMNQLSQQLAGGSGGGVWARGRRGAAGEGSGSAGAPSSSSSKKGSSSAPNPKRMFEEAQMVRRVKAYLGNMRVITDEDQLHRMSEQCEPPPPPPAQQASSSTAPVVLLSPSAASTPAAQQMHLATAAAAATQQSVSAQSL